MPITPKEAKEAYKIIKKKEMKKTRKQIKKRLRSLELNTIFIFKQIDEKLKHNEREFCVGEYFGSNKFNYMKTVFFDFFHDSDSVFSLIETIEYNKVTSYFFNKYILPEYKKLGWACRLVKDEWNKYKDKPTALLKLEFKEEKI